MDSKDFDPSNIIKVDIREVVPNEYNPKKKDTKEYRDVVSSIRVNGLKQPIFVREKDGKYVIVDGEQRYTAAKELGYSEIYIYDLGEISDEEAKSLTIWFEVQVPFDEIMLAPLVVELNESDIELPFTDIELQKFEDMFSGDQSYNAQNDTTKDEGFKTLKIRMASEQFNLVYGAIETVSKNENVSEGRALELLVADGLSGYEQTNYIPKHAEA